MAEPFLNNASGNYYVSFSWKGRRYKRSTGTSNPAAARRAQRIVDGKLEQLKAGLLRLPDGVSIADFVFNGRTEPESVSQDLAVTALVAWYLEQSVPPVKAQSTYVTEGVHLDHLRAFLEKKGVHRVSELTPEVFEAYKRWRLRTGVRNVTVNKELGTFRAMMNASVRAGRVAANPLSQVSWLKEDAVFERFRTGKQIEQDLSSGDYTEGEAARIRRFRYLTSEETVELLETARGTDLYPLLAAAAYTGMRLSELLRLKWSDVDFDAGRALARGHKGSRSERESARYIPLHENLAGILSDCKSHSRSSLVFADHDGNPPRRDRFYALLKRLTRGTAFEGIRFHCLRHSFASNLACQGVDQRLIDSFMGHQTEAMRKRYQHLFPDRQQEAIHKLGF